MVVLIDMTQEAVYAPEPVVGNVPGRLWSLLEMLNQFSTRDFGAFLGNLERASAFSELIIQPPNQKFDRRELLRQAVPQYHSALIGIMAVLLEAKIKLSNAVGLQIGRMVQRLEKGGDFDYAALAAEVRLLRQLLIDDLAEHAFVTVPRQYRELFEQPEPAFGPDVAQKFGKAKRDIEAACRCMALNEWTASVFHCMRVLEHGLEPVADRFGVPFKVESWHTVLRGIEDAIGELRNKQQRALTDFDRKEITYYSALANEFRYFKDAWRNHVSHGRDHYDERDAEVVLSHVKRFMQDLSKGIT